MHGVGVWWQNWSLPNDRERESKKTRQADLLLPPQHDEKAVGLVVVGLARAALCAGDKHLALLSPMLA